MSETERRILHLLAKTPLSLAHLQKTLRLHSSKISKHLSEMYQIGVVKSLEHDNRHLYFLPKNACVSLQTRLNSLEKHVKQNAVYFQDLKRLTTIIKK